MTTRRHTPAQIVLLLQRADDMLGHGRRIDDVAAELGISPATFHRWRAQYGGIKAGDARRLAELAAENRQLRAVAANQILDIVMLRELLRTLASQLDHRLDLVQTLGEQFQMSQRRACQIVGEPRTTVRRALTTVAESDPGFSHRNEKHSTETVFVDFATREGVLG